MGVAREQVLLRLRLKRRRRYQSPVGEVEPRAALGSFEGFAVPWKQLGFDFRSFKNRRDWKLIPRPETFITLSSPNEVVRESPACHGNRPYMKGPRCVAESDI